MDGDVKVWPLYSTVLPGDELLLTKIPFDSLIGARRWFGMATRFARAWIFELGTEFPSRRVVNGAFEIPG